MKVHFDNYQSIKDNLFDKKSLQKLHTHPKKIEKKLLRFASLKSHKNFYIFNQKGKIKLKVLKENAGLISKIIFVIKKYFRNQLSELENLFYASQTLHLRDETYFKSSELLKTLCLEEKKFYWSKKSLTQYFHLLNSLNFAYKKANISENVSATKEYLLEVYESLSNDLDRKNKIRMETLIGISVSSTLNSKSFFRVNPPSCFFNRGGFSERATKLEEEFLDEILSSPSKHLTIREKEKVIRYRADLMRSSCLNKMLYVLSTSASFGFDEERMVANKVYRSILNLTIGEAILLDVGYKGHAMRAEFVKMKHTFKIKLHDSSGVLSYLSKNSSLAKTFYQHFKFHKGMVTISGEIPLDRFERTGQNYLQAIVSMDNRRLREKGSPQYDQFFKVFTSILDNYFPQTKQKIQTGPNCFSQKVRANEKNRFGTVLYKKMRKKFLSFCYAKLLKECRRRLFAQSHRKSSDVSEKEYSFLINELKSNQAVLNPAQLKQSRKFLAKLTKMPSNAEECFHLLRVVRHNIYKQA